MDQINKMQRARDYADYLIESARQHPMKLLKSSAEMPKWSSLDDKLVNLYAEESGKQLHCKELVPTSHLLEKLVHKEKLNTLVVNLYPANEGYSLMLKGRNGSDTETIKLPYEESEMLEYIDNEELPPILVDLLDRAQANIFYSGCIIVEMRDYRRTTNNTCDVQYVLLRPTAHSLLCDINTLTSDGHRWTQEDKLTLESQLILATEEPICLDPSPAVAMVASQLNYEKHKFNTVALKKSVKRYSQAAVNRKRKFAQCPAPKSLRLHDFVVKKKDQLKGVPPVNLKVGKTCVDTWRQQEVQLSPPETIDVEKYAKVIERSKITLDNTPVTVEEYTFETECSQGKVNFTRLAIQQRMTDDYYIGELYVDHDYVEGKLKGSTCKFPLGTKANVEKYISQFRYSFEEGRRVVKITHTKPGQAPQVTYAQPIPPSTPTTPVAPHMTSAGATPSQTTPHVTAQAVISQATTLAANITRQLDPSVAPIQVTDTNSSGSSKPTAPIKLQLSLNTGMAAVGGANLISPPGGATLQSPVGGAHAQLTLNLPQQALAAQRLRQMSSGFASPPGGPPSTPSPVSQVTAAVSQLPSYTQATGLASISVATTSAAQVVKMPTPSPTPPPNSRTPTPNSVRSAEVLTSPHPLPQGINLSSFIQASNLASSAPTSDASGSTQHQPAPPNINITNIAGLPANINIQNLASLQGMGLGLQSLQNLQNVQVSLAAVPVSVPFSMMTSTPSTSLITSPAGLQLIGSLPPGSAPLTTTANAPGAAGDSRIVTTSSVANLVTMVTSLPTLSSSVSSVSSASLSVSAAAGLLTSSTPVLSSTGSGMLQLPIGMAGSLTQFVTAAGLKNTSQGLRAAAQPLSVVQIPSQQSIHLLSTNIHQARAQLAAQAQQTGKVSAGALSPNTGLQLASPSLSTQPVTGLSQLTGTSSRSAAAATTPFISLTPQQQNINQQQLAQIAFLQQQQLKQQQLQQQQQHQPQPTQSRSKSKKRTTPTPPKNT